MHVRMIQGLHENIIFLFFYFYFEKLLFLILVWLGTTNYILYLFILMNLLYKIHTDVLSRVEGISLLLLLLLFTSD